MSGRPANDVDPGDVWAYKGIEVRIIGTAIVRGNLSGDQTVLAVVYKREGEHPLFFVRERKEFIELYKKKSYRSRR